MGNRTFSADTHSAGVGLVYLDFSFLANGASDPAKSSWRGETSFISSIVHSATGIYTVTITDAWRYAIAKYPDMEDLNSSDDGAYASMGPLQTEGSAGATFKLYTRNAGGTKTDYSARRVSFSLCFKNSTVGS
jgi:hypothetical protein